MLGTAASFWAYRAERDADDALFEGFNKKKLHPTKGGWCSPLENTQHGTP